MALQEMNCSLFGELARTKLGHRLHAQRIALLVSHEEESETNRNTISKFESDCDNKQRVLMAVNG